MRIHEDYTNVRKEFKFGPLPKQFQSQMIFMVSYWQHSKRNMLLTLKRLVSRVDDQLAH